MSYRQIFQDVFMIRKILVIKNEQCLPVFEMDMNSQIAIDPSIICDILEGNSENVEKISVTTNISKIKYYSFIVISASYGGYTTYLFVEREVDELIDQKVIELSKWFDLVLGYDSSEVEYSKEFVEYYKSSITDKVTELFNFWLLFPLEAVIDYIPESEDFSENHKEILNYLKINKQASVMRIVNDFQNLEQEEVLKIIFELLREKCIITQTSDQYTRTFFELEKAGF